MCYTKNVALAVIFFNEIGKNSVYISYTFFFNGLITNLTTRKFFISQVGLSDSET